MKSSTSVRGSDAVKSALIKAASELLAELGPRSVSVREVARRAGVNHAQVHHYFGSKRSLLRETMKELAQGHYEHMKSVAHPDGFPRPMALAEDTMYWRSLSQVMVAGDLELARTEIDEGISVPQEAFELMKAQLGDQESELALRSRFASTAALALGWTVFEELLFVMAEISDEDRNAAREEVKGILDEISGRKGKSHE